jgi:hypothetical protein
MFAGWTPRGRYRLKDALVSSGLETKFDAIVVWADASGENVPLELDAFDCPKVLCVGDTQHCPSPLRKMLDYARHAKYDFVLSSHNRQHLHWFADVGFTNVAWFPGIKVRHLPRSFETSRKSCVSFLGNAGAHHPRRWRLLQTLHRAVPLVAARGSRDYAADMCASSAVSFNASLNGDLNLRVFETLSAGGCLLTDRLSVQSGLDLILKEGENFAGYDSVDECVEQARFLLAHPDVALKLARSGHDAFVSSMLPERRAAQLLSWIFDGELDELFRCPRHPAGDARGAPLADRLRIYEELQELHRVEESPRVLFTEGVAEYRAAMKLNGDPLMCEEDVIRLFQGFAQQRARDDSAQHSYGIVLRQYGHYDEALKIQQKVATRSPSKAIQDEIEALQKVLSRKTGDVLQ